MKLATAFIFTVVGLLPSMAYAATADSSESVTADEILAPPAVETQQVQSYRPVPEPKANVDEFKRERQTAQSGEAVGDNSEDSHWKEVTHSNGAKKAGSNKKMSNKKQKISRHKTKPVRKIASHSPKTKHKHVRRSSGYQKRKSTAAAIELALPPKKKHSLPGQTFAGG